MNIDVFDYKYIIAALAIKGGWRRRTYANHVTVT